MKSPGSVSYPGTIDMPGWVMLSHAGLSCALLMHSNLISTLRMSVATHAHGQSKMSPGIVKCPHRVGKKVSQD